MFHCSFVYLDHAVNSKIKFLKYYFQCVPAPNYLAIATWPASMLLYNYNNYYIEDELATSISIMHADFHNYYRVRSSIISKE